MSEHFESGFYHYAATIPADAPAPWRVRVFRPGDQPAAELPVPSTLTTVDAVSAHAWSLLSERDDWTAFAVLRLCSGGGYQVERFRRP